jgi:hypothetical protein
VFTVVVDHYRIFAYRQHGFEINCNYKFASSFLPRVRPAPTSRPPFDGDEKQNVYDSEPKGSTIGTCVDEKPNDWWI